jgi:hypothetical protein
VHLARPMLTGSTAAGRAAPNRLRRRPAGPNHPDCQRRRQDRRRPGLRLRNGNRTFSRLAATAAKARLRQRKAGNHGAGPSTVADRRLRASWMACRSRVGAPGDQPNPDPRAEVVGAGCRMGEGHRIYPFSSAATGSNYRIKCSTSSDIGIVANGGK